MPLAFVERAGKFHAVAVMSPVAGRNFFVGPKGQWLGRHIPALLSVRPFGLVRRNSGSEEWMLCLDEQSGSVVEAGEGEPFFEADGALVPKVKVVLEFLRAFEQGRLQLDTAVAALGQAGLICPWQVEVKLAEGEVKPVPLYRIDEVALNKVSDQALIALRRAGALAVGYGQLFSMAQFEVLQRLVGLQMEMARNALGEGGRSGGAFNLPDEGSLHFG